MNHINKVTLKDIAQFLNISPTTVANALKGNPNVSDALRKKIRSTAEQMGYKPNFNAKAMVKNGISIALVTVDEPVEYTIPLRKSILNEIKRLADYKISLTEYIYHDNMSTAEVEAFIKKMTQETYDGIIMGPSFEKESYQPLIKEYMQNHPNTKLVYLHEEIQDTPCCCTVKVDNATIGRIAAQLVYLAYGNSAKVGVITTSEKYSGHKETVMTFLEECSKYHITVAEVLENNDSRTETYNCTKKLLEKYPDIRVIYQTSYDSGQVCRCIENQGMQDRVKVIAHDIHEKILEYMENGQILATIYQNQPEIGRLCVQTVVNAILGEDPKERFVLVRPEVVLKANLDAYRKEILG